MSKLKISVYQSDIVFNNSFENINNLKKYLYKGIDTEIIILPEMFTTGYDKYPEKIALSMYSAEIQKIIELSAKFSVAIAFSFVCKENNAFFNRFVFIKPDGDFYKYDKKHLFRISGENAYYTAGYNTGIFEYKGWRIRPAICYDLRFPVWLRNRNDYDLLIIVANWPESRRKVWDVLLKARAIENQVFVAAVNRIGTDIYNTFHNGGSVIISPYGKELLHIPDNQEVIYTSEISLDELHKFREDFPVFLDADEFIIK